LSSSLAGRHGRPLGRAEAAFSDVTIVKDLVRGDMANALKTFAQKADGADWAVIHYAGHGIEPEGKNFLIPIDAALKDVRDIEDETISLERVLLSVKGTNKLRPDHLG